MSDEKLKVENERMRAALKRCSDLFSEIRGDWTDPRNQCREGWRVIDEALGDE